MVNAQVTSWKDSLQRRDEVKAAFVEGYLGALDDDANPYSEDAARTMAEERWTESAARRKLEEPLEEKP